MRPEYNIAHYRPFDQEKLISRFGRKKRTQQAVGQANRISRISNTGQHSTEKKVSKAKTTKPDSMSVSDLAPFVAAVIEDGIIAEMQRKNKELESKI